jgi:hypothetical protein
MLRVFFIGASGGDLCGRRRRGKSIRIAVGSALPSGEPGRGLSRLTHAARYPT